MDPAEYDTYFVLPLSGPSQHLSNGQDSHLQDPLNGLTTPTAASTAESHIPPPAKYLGDLNSCRQVLNQCQLTFNAQPTRYHSEVAKITYIANLLEGPPFGLFNALYEQASLSVLSFTALAAEKDMFLIFLFRGSMQVMLFGNYIKKS